MSHKDMTSLTSRSASKTDWSAYGYFLFSSTVANVTEIDSDFWDTLYYRAAEVGIAACIYDPASEVVSRPIHDPAAGVGISAYIRCGYRIVRPLYVAS